MFRCCANRTMGWLSIGNSITWAAVMIAVAFALKDSPQRETVNMVVFTGWMASMGLMSAVSMKTTPKTPPDQPPVR